MALKIDGELGSETAGTKASDVTVPEDDKTKDKKWLKRIGITIWEHFKDNLASWILTIIGVAIITLFAWYYGLDKQIAVYNSKIDFLEKKFSESEIAYKERVERELKLTKCLNGVILECYNKCNLQEVLRRQNNCDLIAK